MMNAYEQRLIALYLANAAAFLHHHDPEASELAEWVADRDNRAAFGSRRKRLRRRSVEPDEGMSGRKWRSLQEALREESSAAGKARPDRTAQRLRRLARTTDLGRTDVRILELLLRYRTQPVIESMLDDVFGGGRIRAMNVMNVRSPALPAVLGLSTNTVQRRFRKDAPLVRAGLVTIDSDGDLSPVGRLSRLASAPGGAGLDVNRLLLDPAPRSDLDWSDFDHLARDRDHVERILAGALGSGAPGVNVLLYGPPGTGKTEFCKVLAERLGVSLFSVGESDDDGDEPVRGERLQELRLAQRLLARDRGSLLLFDEMEDLLSGPSLELGFLFGPSFSSGFRERGSKVFMHRMLEEAPTPTLWTMNDPRWASDTILRRMMFALEMRPPAPAVKARIWARQLDQHGIEAGADDVRSLAREFAANPGVAAGATAAARLGGGGIDDVRRGVRSLSRALGCERPPQVAPERFDLALLRADTGLARLVERLESLPDRRFSLCLQGPPGTGKSAFVRYLAERLGLEVLQKRTSDLLSMWVGGTEKRIAAAFAEARDTGAFLVFDEADSLLADRRSAERSWEVSQVNEMLTWMESHPLPFACTTNFGERLDPATLRRFVFKATLDYLEPGQAEAAFRGYFALTPPGRLASLGNLTPGDFSVVRRKAELLGEADDPDALLAMLRDECEAKPGRPRPIGFRP